MSPLLLALLHAAAFLDLSEDRSVDPEAAGAVLGRIGLYVQRLDDDSIEALANDLEDLETYARGAGWPEPAIEFVASFLQHCGFELQTDEDEDEDEDTKPAPAPPPRGAGPSKRR